MCDKLNTSSKNLTGLFNRFASKPEGISLQISPFSTELYCTSLLSRSLCLSIVSKSLCQLLKNRHYEMLLLLFRHYSHLISEKLYYFGPHILSIINNSPSIFSHMGLILGPFQMCNFSPRNNVNVFIAYSNFLIANWVEKFSAWVLTLLWFTEEIKPQHNISRDGQLGRELLLTFQESISAYWSLLTGMEQR